MKEERGAKMKWGRKVRDDDWKKMKGNAKNTSPPSSSLPSSLFSGIFSFSWISRLKRGSTSRLKSDSSPAKHKLAFLSGSDHLSYSPPVLDRIVACDAPRRRSVGDDNHRHGKDCRRRIGEVSLSTRHNSLGELELRPIEVEPPALPSSTSRRRQWRDRRRQRSLGARSPASRSPLKQINISITRDGRSKIGSGGKLRQRMRPRVKVCSPRVAAALRRVEEGDERKSLESFAVVKRSSHPEGDFRESMTEMIREKGIGRPEEMERLLACYIALNADEHHDVIVKAFRRVWFDVIDGRRFAGGGCRR